MRKCAKCSIVKALTEFSKNGVDSSGRVKYRYDCKGCYNLDWKNRIMSNMTSRESRRVRAGSKNLRRAIKRDSRINRLYLERLKDNQNGRCYWLGIDMDFSLKDKLRKPSLDRLDNSKGYEVGNVVLTTVFANTGRRDASVVEMSLFLENHLFKTYYANH